MDDQFREAIARAEQAIAQASWTKPSVASILTSQQAYFSRVRAGAAEPFCPSGFPLASGIHATQCPPRASLFTARPACVLSAMDAIVYRREPKIVIALAKAVPIQFKGLAASCGREERDIDGFYLSQLRERPELSGQDPADARRSAAGCPRRGQ